MIPDINVRKAEDKDIPRIMEIENVCFIAPWKENDVLYELHENIVSNFWVIEVDGKIAGFADYWKTFDSATIAQIAIDPKKQKQHLGSYLLKEIISDCYAKKVRNITLEVRIHNVNAINLYKKYGFEQILVKEHYYSNGDDAIYMIRKVEN